MHVINTKEDYIWWLVAALLSLNILNLSLWAFGVHLPIYFLLFAALLTLGLFVSRYLQRGLFLMVTMLLFVLLILSFPLHEWDARSIWFFHAKQIWYQDNLYAYLTDYAIWSHNDYPPLIPALAASLTEEVGHWNEIFPRLSVLFAIFPVLIVFSLSFKTDRFYVLWLTSILVLYCGTAGLLSGYMDRILAINIAAVLLLFPFLVQEQSGSKRASRLIVFFLLLATLPLIKNEGVLAAFIISMFIVALYWRQVNLLGFLLLSWVPWLFFWKLPLITFEIQNDLFVAGALQKGIERLSNHTDLVLIGRHLAEELAVWAIILLAAWWLMKNASIRFQVLTAFIALYVSAMLLIYLITPLDLAWHLSTSAGRVFGVASLCVLFLLLLEADHSIRSIHEKTDQTNLD